MRKIWTIVFYISLLTTPLKAQEVIYYIYEDFETDSRDLWISTPSDPNVKWIFQDGGFNDLPPWDYQVDGANNAVFKRYNATGAEYRLLESPTIDLSAASMPQLVFAHAQHNLFSFQDEMYLMFKAGTSADWDTIEYYPNYVYPWTERFYNIHEYGEKYLVEDFQLGFLGVGKGGNGVCIDSVVIEEKDVIPKYVRNFSIEQVDHSILPSGIENVPLLKIYVEVFGNVSSQVLNSIDFTSLGTSDLDFPTGAFDIYRTRNEIFKSEENGVSNQIGSSASISSGTVSFTDIAFTLQTGDNYIWLTANIDQNAGHNNIVDFRLDQNSISISDTLLPIANVNPSGYSVIKESLLFDNFETLKGWTLGGDFEIDTPQGKVVNISADPGYAYSGVKILGTDLKEDGGYLPGIGPGTEYYAVAPAVNLKYYKDIKLYAQKWISFDFDDKVYIEVSADGGSTWVPIWDRQNDFGTGIAENGWNELIVENNIDENVAIHENVIFRLAMKETDIGYVLAGWNLDDFAIVGNHLETDVGITQVLSPYNDCIGTFNDSVKIVVRNYAEGPTAAQIPVFYSLNGIGGTLIYDTIQGPIAQDDSVVFVFAQNAGFPAPGSYDFVVGTSLANDEDQSNDLAYVDIYLQNNIEAPYTENFETGKGYWLKSSGSKWDCVVPSGGVPTLPESPKSWFVAPTTVYLNSEDSWITSSCYDLVNEDKLVLEMKYWNESEAGVDGANVQYSTDDGQTWTTLTNTAFGDYSNWYSSSVSALGDIGWSGITGDWVTAREYIPSALNLEPSVKFRVHWSTNGTNAIGRGIVIDDFSIYQAPPDLGVTSFATPIDACQLINDGSVQVYVENFGVNKMYAGDSVIVGVNLDTNAPEFDTIILAADILPGATALLTAEVNLDLSEAKTYSLYAYTMIENDPYFYSLTSNDTAYHSFTVWPNPVTDLPDTVSSREPKTMVLQVYQSVPAGYSILWFDGDTTNEHSVSQSDVFYNVFVTEPVHSCVAEDSVYVQLLFNDVGIDSVLSPISSCELGSSELVQVQLRNHGTDSLFVDDEIVLYYMVNGGPVYRDTIILDAPLVPNGTISHPFNDERYDFSQEMSYEIKSWAFYAGDTVKVNDSTTFDLDIYGYPSVDLGANASIAALEYTLDAGIGFADYLWSTGDTTQTTDINTSGNYWIKVENEYGCPDYDTVNIWFKIRDILVFNLFNPADGCYSGQEELVSISVQNNGTDTILATDAIQISYTMNGGSVVENTVYLSESLVPGQYGLLNFSSFLPTLPLGTSIFDAWVKIAGDLRVNNDSVLSVNVNRAASPVVDLGVDRAIVQSEEILDAGAGTNYAYVWQDGSKLRTFIATQTADYYCTVTDESTGCSGSDTVTLDFDYTDFAVYSFGVGNSECQGAKGGVDVQILNNSSKTKVDQSFNLGFSISNGDTISESFVIDGFWFPGEQREITLSNDLNFENTGNNVVNIFFIGFQDLNTNNDLLSKSVDVLELPNVDFGGDTLYVNLPYTLDPGGGFTSYQWQDNSTDRYFEVEYTGRYTVTVANAYCNNTKSVFVQPPSGIEDLYENLLDVSCYPNPASSLLSIEANLDGLSETTFELFDVNSQVIWSDVQTGHYYHKDLDVGAFNSGVYYLRAYNKDGYWITKIIIE